MQSQESQSSHEPTTETSDAWPPIPPLIALATQTFLRDLPELLKKRHLHWVAYSGDNQIGFARNPFKLRRQCQALGLKPTEYYVYRIEPDPFPEEVEIVSDFDDE